MPDAQLEGAVHLAGKSAAVEINSKATDGPGRT
jgi:hypothetical protein